MSFFPFKDEDIINTNVVAFPAYNVEFNGTAVTGSIFLEKEFLNSALETRRHFGFSDREGGLVQKDGPFTASIDIIDAEQNATNKEFYESLLELYDFYSFLNEDYTSDFTGSATTRFRVITIPEIYYDRQILTGSFTASDFDSAGDTRLLFDNGTGGIYSGSLSGTLVGNIFYNEGLAVLKGGGLNDESSGNEFGEDSPTDFKWNVKFKGTHKIPVKIFRCRAPAGQLNASSNSSFFIIPTGSQEPHKNEKEIIVDPLFTYVTAVGLYDEDFELVGTAQLAQPVRKDEFQDLLFRLRLDF